MTVLLIDDQGVDIRAKLLTTLGYDVLTATTGAEGLELALADRVNAVVLDLGLPDISGVDALRALKQRSLPVVVLSGQIRIPDEVVRLADAVVVKGQGVDLLLDALREVRK